MRLLRSLLIVLAVALPMGASPLGAQTRLAADTEVRSSPTGNPVATLEAGTSWSAGVTRDGWTLLTVQGWMESSRFAGPRDTFPQSIGGTNTLRIREEPSLNGRILGEFLGGAGLRVVERRGNWARIRRDVWAPAGSFERQTATSTPPATPAGTPAGSTPSAVEAGTPPGESLAVDLPPRAAGSLKAEAPVSLRASPGGTTLGELAPGTVVAPQARDRGWVKVRIDAWVAESLFVPADSTYSETLSAADLRIAPDEHKGKVVRWEVQVAGLQNADPLRRDLAPNEPFLLAMGPTGEDAILYVAVPPSLLNDARAITPLERVILTARVRVGRSDPTGAPVLDLLSIVRR